MNFKSFSFLFLFFLFWITSCDSDRLFEKNKDIPNNVWDKNFIPSFEFEIQDTLQLYVLSVNVRHTHFYPFSNLWVMIYTQFPDSTQIQSRVELPLAENSGKWYGSCMGDICDANVFIQKKTKFNQVGKHSIRFEQIMRNKTDNIEHLPGIMAIGLKVEKYVAEK